MSAPVRSSFLGLKRNDFLHLQFWIPSRCDLFTLRACARQGCIAAMLLLALGHCDDTLEKNIVLSSQWRCKAESALGLECESLDERALSKHPFLAFAKGLFLYFGIPPSPKDPHHAAVYLRLSAEQGDPFGEYLLGCCFDYGVGVSQDVNEAARCYERAAVLGCAWAQNDYGFVLQHGIGVSRDLTQAIGWFQKAAEQGLAAAQTNLGHCYTVGEGFPKDEKRAVELHQQAGAQGNAFSQYALGVCFKDGLGVDVDRDEALMWFRKAAAQGFHDAELEMEVMAGP